MHSLSLTLLLLLSAPLAWAQTYFTGDVLSGYPVITSLDIADAPPNTVTRYWFLAAEAQGGIPYLLPVFVVRGTDESLETGHKLSLSASVHGDELNGIAVVQGVLSQLNETVSDGGFNGTIIAVPTMNPNGNQHNQRNFYSSSSNGFLTDLNRVFPGEDPLEGAPIAEGYAFNIWNYLWGDTSNIDVAVDLHTPSTGDTGPFWCYADYRQPYVQRLAELAQPDIIKIDPGEPGSIETTMVDNFIPAITLEIGSPKVWETEYIMRAQDFIFRVLEDLNMIQPSSDGTSTGLEVDLSDTYIATNISDVYTTQTGWVQTFADVLDDVVAGQDIGIVFNSWGDIIENLTSSVTGRVLQRRIDPAVEQGTRVMVIAYNDTTEGIYP